jgi:hypothetical protein
VDDEPDAGLGCGVTGIVEPVPGTLAVEGWMRNATDDDFPPNLMVHYKITFLIL